VGVRVIVSASMGHDSPEPSTISDVSMPSIRQMLAELASGRRRYLHMSSQLRLRLKHGMRDWMRARLHI